MAYDASKENTSRIDCGYDIAYAEGWSESLVERDSKTYRYQGRFASPMFVEVAEGTESGFWSGKIITEYDLNLSMRFYYMEPDVNDVFESIVEFGKYCIIAMLITEVTVVALANLEAIHYYCQTWGIRDGLDMYRMLGTQYVPNGLLSQIQSYEGTATAPNPGDPGFVGPLEEIDAARASNWTKPDGSTWWPSNNGAVPGSENMVSLKPGAEIGRIGGDEGSFASPPGSSPESLSLKPGTDVSVYKEYKVIKEIPDVEQATIAPWFDMPGGGIQYKLPMSIRELKQGGYIE